MRLTRRKREVQGLLDKKIGSGSGLSAEIRTLALLRRSLTSSNETGPNLDVGVAKRRVIFKSPVNFHFLNSVVDVLRQISGRNFRNVIDRRCGSSIVM